MTKYERLIHEAANQTGVKVNVSEQMVMGGEQSEIITLTVTNNNIGIVNLVLGTPAGIQREQAFFPGIVAAIGAIATDAASAALVTDNQGVGATFIQGLNDRFVRNQVFIEAIEIVTADAAQRGNRLTMLEVPYNSATDFRRVANKFIPVDTEYTGNDVLGKKGALLGDFVGIEYQLNVGILVDINIKIGAVNAPSFVKCGC